MKYRRARDLAKWMMTWFVSVHPLSPQEYMSRDYSPFRHWLASWRLRKRRPWIDGL